MSRAGGVYGGDSPADVSSAGGPALPESPWAIEVSGLVRRYGPVVAVNQLHMKVPYGSLYGLVGPNGAGKTTTFSMLMGYISPDGGQARLLGTPIQNIHTLLGRVTALPQDAMMYPTFKVGQVLHYFARLSGVPPPEIESSVRRVLEWVGLPEAYGMKAGKLSHGQHKRILLAQALLGDPELILLDEPTSGLDPKTAVFIRQLFRELAKNRTLVVSSHNLAEIQEICTHVGIINHGKMVLEAPIDEFRGVGETLEFELAPHSVIPQALLDPHPSVAKSAYDQNLGVLTVTVNRQNSNADEVTTRTLRLLLDAGAPIRGVSRGKSIEEKFLELT
ncbi:MAG: Vitamin B12 import ATP-binding protein BtuD [Myxococcota bacterium]|nr:Vitamin B12 import ATP-binding protein BtuD [Myxococcota bacterium]